MKSLITIPCSCGKHLPLQVIGSKLPGYTKCDACGAAIHLIAPLGNIVTMLLMERAKREFANGDMTITIVLSAVAVEGEMAYLFFKWKGISLLHAMDMERIKRMDDEHRKARESTCV